MDSRQYQSGPACGKKVNESKYVGVVRFCRLVSTHTPITIAAIEAARKP